MRPEEQRVVFFNLVILFPFIELLILFNLGLEDDSATALVGKRKAPGVGAPIRPLPPIKAPLNTSAQAVSPTLTTGKSLQPANKRKFLYI